MPATFAASIDSWSRTEPPGWTTAFTPASMSTCRPSAKGKNASDAATAPMERCSGASATTSEARAPPALSTLDAAASPVEREPSVFARSTASLHESTRFTWPMPTPTDAPSLTSRIAFERTARTVRHANSRSASVASSAGAPAASVQFSGESPGASISSRSWTNRPPLICLNSYEPRAGGSTCRTRRFFFALSTSSAPSS